MPLSDVYAMGGSPNLAMNLICFPNCLPLDVLEGYCRAAMTRSGRLELIIVGGHTIEDPEPKYGLCVTGFLHPKDVLANSTAKEGDLLVLTQALGPWSDDHRQQGRPGQPGGVSGDGPADDHPQQRRPRGDAAGRAGAHACTDVTGFGMLGHTYEMASGCGMTVELYAKDLPLIPSAVEYAKMGTYPRWGL